MFPEWLTEKARRVRLLILDVDGVLTRGEVLLVDADGEGKLFHVSDGGAIRIAQRAGLEVALLTGRRSRVVQRRGAELGIERVVQGALRKGPAVEELIRETRLEAEEVAMMGDELIDLPVFQRVGLSLAPGDARFQVRSRADLVTRTEGGRGAVAEAVEFLLRIKGRWDEQFARYDGP